MWPLAPQASPVSLSGEQPSSKGVSAREAEAEPWRIITSVALIWPKKIMLPAQIPGGHTELAPNAGLVAQSTDVRRMGKWGHFTRSLNTPRTLLVDVAQCPVVNTHAVVSLA